MLEKIAEELLQCKLSICLYESVSFDLLKENNGHYSEGAAVLTLNGSNY